MARKKGERRHVRDLSGGTGERPPAWAGLGPGERERIRETERRASVEEASGDPFASAYVSGELRRARGEPDRGE